MPFLTASAAFVLDSPKASAQIQSSRMALTLTVLGSYFGSYKAAVSVLDRETLYRPIFVRFISIYAAISSMQKNCGQFPFGRISPIISRLMPRPISEPNTSL